MPTRVPCVTTGRWRTSAATIRSAASWTVLVLSTVTGFGVIISSALRDGRVWCTLGIGLSSLLVLQMYIHGPQWPRYWALLPWALGHLKKSDQDRAITLMPQGGRASTVWGILL